MTAQIIAGRKIAARPPEEVGAAGVGGLPWNAVRAARNVTVASAGR